MSNIMKLFQGIVTVLLVFLSNNTYSLELKYPTTEEEWEVAFLELNFESNQAQYDFKNAHQSYNLLEGWEILREDDARKFLFYINGSDTFKDVEAVALSQDFEYQLIFSYHDIGFVDDSDWELLDSDTLLEGLIEGTNDANKERLANNVSPLHVLGWESRPTYDRDKETAYFAVNLNQDGEVMTNSRALKLGRDGFTSITLVGPSQGKLESKSVLMVGINNHNYDEGYRYSDYEKGNRIADIGLGSLLALTAGSKNGKGVAAGLVATLLFFAKKLWFIIFLPFIFMWNKIKLIFSNKVT